MIDDERIEALMDAWEALSQEGKELSAEAICADCPELLDRFKERRDKLRLFDNAFVDTWITEGQGSNEIGEFCNGRYRVGFRHEQGGLGTLYLARDLELGRTVVVKAIRAGYRENLECRRHFVNEASITGQLEHPGIVPVFGFGYDERKHPYYAMRMIRGTTLREPIRQFHNGGPAGGTVQLSLQRLLRDFLSVCQTIQYAHSRGVIHRDIKPANIMVGRFGEVFVVDWGLAKRISAPEVLSDPIDESASMEENLGPIATPQVVETQQGLVKGSPIYMSPEQAEGRTAEIGPASDIYSLGATLYEILTGHAPFEGSGVDIVQDVGRGKLRPPHETKAGVPPALEAICLKAMQRDPRDRYPTVKSLADDIENYLADEPVSAYPEPLSAVARRWARRHSTVVAGAAALVLTTLVALLVISGLLVRHNRDLSIAKAAAEDARADAQAAEQEERRRASELESSLYANQLMLAGAAWADGDLRRTREVLRATKPALRALEWSLAERQTQSPPLMPYYVSRPTPEQTITGMQWNSTGTWLRVEVASPLPGKSVGGRSSQLISLAGKTPKLGAAAGFLAFSPDGTKQLRRVHAGDEKKYRLALMDLANGLPVWQTDVLEDKSYNLFGGGFFVRDPAQDKDIAWLQKDAKLANDPSPLVVVATDKWATLPSGKQTRIAQFDFRDAQTGGIVMSIDGDDVGNATRAHFDDTGRLLALSTSAPGTHTVSVHSSVNGKALYTLSGHTGRINAVAFSNDSKRLATASADRSVRTWDAATGRPLATYWGSLGPVLAVAYDATGSQVAAAGEDGTVRVWNVSSGEMVRVVPVSDDGVFALAFGRRDRLLSFGGTEGHISQIDLLASSAGADTVIREKDFVRKVRWNTRGDALAAVVSGAGSVVRVYDRAGSKLRFQVELLNPKSKSRSLYVEDAAFQPGGEALAVAGDEFVRVVDARSGAKRWELPGFRGPLAYAPDGNTLVAHQEARGAMVVLDASDGKTVRVLPPAAGAGNRFAMHPSQPLIAIAADDAIGLWNLETGDPISTIEAHQGTIWSLSFSPDGQRLVVVGIDQSRAAVVDVKTGKTTQTLVGNVRAMQDAQFTPDGRRVLTCATDGTLRVWDAQDGAQLWVCEAAQSPLFSLAISQDGHHLAVAGGEPKAAPFGLILGWTLPAR